CFQTRMKRLYSGKTRCSRSRICTRERLLPSCRSLPSPSTNARRNARARAKELLPAADPSQRDYVWDCHPFFVWRAHGWAAFRNEVCDVCVDEMRHRHAAL
ncbi:unnamed protein product, partial [Mycena citricolor]